MSLQNAATTQHPGRVHVQQSLSVIYWGHQYQLAVRCNQSKKTCAIVHFYPITGRKDQSRKIRDEIKRIDNAQLAFVRETIFTTSPEMPEAPVNNEIRVLSIFCCWTFRAS